MEPRGLIAIGYVEKPPYEDVHWDEKRAARGEQALYVGAAWEYFSVTPVIPRERLDHSPFNQVHWNTQRSGISISDEIGNALELEFRSAIGQQSAFLPDEAHAMTKLPEGAIRRVIVNAYERNPEARRLCIQHYGSVCAACGVDLGAIYGSVAVGHIHVHHLYPLSQVGESYTVDPIRDLRPVCPNCHAVIHLRRESPYSIEQVKDMWRRQRDST
jgi:5-methylcytosine-specific restriction protein A